MKAILVTHSSPYEPRLEKVGQFLQEHGHQVLWVESDFDHHRKKNGRPASEHHVYLQTVSYQRNLSARRLYSHYDFSKKVLKLLRQETFDLLYVMLPANSLAPIAAQFKKEYPDTRLVFDVIDLWPESLPFRGMERFWPVQYWRRLRDDHLDAADLILTECQLYREKLRLRGKEENSGQGTQSESSVQETIGRTEVMYWPKQMDAPRMEWTSDPETFTAVYLGSMNHIIDIEGIRAVLRQLQTKINVRLHIIGDGESREKFLKALAEDQIDYEYHGLVYDEAEKTRIFARCDCGINMMKNSVCVGLTMKSVDYFCYGLPIINNIPGDTWTLVEQYDAGVNVGEATETLSAETSGDGLKRAVEAAVADALLAMKVGSEEECLARHLRIQKMYQKFFTEQAMEAVLEEYLLPLLEPGTRQE
jgi:glycosyltransferase involved in cell wall biosynthesis